MPIQSVHTGAGDAASTPGRGERAEHALIGAVLDLIDEEGVTGLTVDKIAARAKVGKPTIYRRWANKEELVAHALGASETPPTFDPDGELRSTLVSVLTNLSDRLTSTRVGRVWCRLVGSDDRYSEATRLYADGFIAPRIAAMTQLLQREIRAGSLRPDLDPLVTVTMMVSTVVGGILNIRPTGQPAPDPEVIVDTFLRGIVR